MLGFPLAAALSAQLLQASRPEASRRSKGKQRLLQRQMSDNLYVSDHEHS